MIGRIERVPLRDVWKHEERDFSRWLNDNIGVLSDVVGVPLESTEIEAPAGSFSVDIIAKDNSGNYVIIENQLEISDHDHLGKIITYLTMWEAKSAIWIVKDPRPEHVKAITWLNESSEASFYMVKIEAIKIGDSPPAPLLTKIVGPSEEVRATSRLKSEYSETEKKLIKFWEVLLNHSKSKTTLFANISPGPWNWIGRSAGLGSNSYYSFVANKNKARVELYILCSEPGKVDGIADYLQDKKSEIENDFGGPLEWTVPDGTRKSYSVYKWLDMGGYQSPESKWPAIHEAMIDVIIRLENALRKHTKHLKGMI